MWGEGSSRRKGRRTEEGSSHTMKGEGRRRELVSLATATSGKGGAVCSLNVDLSEPLAAQWKSAGRVPRRASKLRGHRS